MAPQGYSGFMYDRRSSLSSCDRWTSLTVSYVSMAYLAADSAYSAFNIIRWLPEISYRQRIIWAVLMRAAHTLEYGFGRLPGTAKSGKNGSYVIERASNSRETCGWCKRCSKVIYPLRQIKIRTQRFRICIGQRDGQWDVVGRELYCKNLEHRAVDVPGC